jgi:hypothetical protein
VAAATTMARFVFVLLFISVLGLKLALLVCSFDIWFERMNTNQPWVRHFGHEALHIIGILASYNKQYT